MKKTVSQFIFDEIARQGVDSIFGVPGDFNLAFLDEIIAHPTLNWIGNTNELNAAYAADGYARIKGLSALVTTFGVGELSAVNGIAGSYAERVPVIAITGGPTTVVENAGKYVHHSLGEGQFDVYQKMFEPITVAQTYVTPENALTEIPRVIQAAIDDKRPVHIHLPIDTAMVEIEVPEQVEYPENRSSDKTDWVSTVEQKLKQAKQPTLIVGHEINSFQLHNELRDLVDQLKLPVAQLSLGKSAFDETHPNYMGIYDGSIAHEPIKSYVDNSDLVLTLGAKLTDSATAGFSQKFSNDKVVMLNHKNIQFDDQTMSPMSLSDIIQTLKTMNYQFDGEFPQFAQSTHTEVDVDDKPLTQEKYFEVMQNFIQPNDVLLAEQGTSFFGAYELALPKDVTFIGQPLWGSIGYTFPSTLGTQLADRNRRNVLLIGDGSLQLTVQELATMLRHDLHPVLFIINNDGYTVERKIHGEHQPYNDIGSWNYRLLPTVFGNKDIPTYNVTTSRELKAAMDKVNEHPQSMHLVEVHMDKHDAPEKLANIAKAFATQNK
ncbi:alpha-keto acid decarboxylase family protein [Staphylococcus chromogenes]|uniref:alpha-keto acid decarboxylase family protein n=1 Tax=Staphylococcus chromogenes TaxID=46126 RepID=UPI00227CC36A|nr:alpha-keto acid decarboxylase family protein [Staphylococcus chromogenes]WAG30934.1 alpha-keto acid decarboxylase family protein [Staphylococcus chromogenes]